MENQSQIDEACKRYLSYRNTILDPAAEEFLSSLSCGGTISLHQAFGVNLFAAHAVDYLVGIRSAAGIPGGRGQLVKDFDRLFGVDGGRIQNGKFQLIDAVNNALKHIELDRNRYSDLLSQYGDISFQCLAEFQGRVLCLLSGYRFDYSRVVLRPVLEALTCALLEDEGDVLGFARGEWGEIAVEDSSWDDDPIDQMIEYCNPVCSDCGEGEAECFCAEYIYAGDKGEFVPIVYDNFDFDAVMSRISGAYRPNG